MTSSNPDSPPRPAASAPSLPLSAEPAPNSLRRRRESSGHSDEASDQARKKLRTSDLSTSAAGVALQSNPTAGASAGAHISALESAHRSGAKMVNSPERPGADLPSSPEAHSANGHSSSMTNGHSNGNGIGVADQIDTDRSTNRSDGDRPSKRLDAMEYEGDEGFVPLWKGSNLDRREFVRLAMQAFEDMGYTCVPSLCFALYPQAQRQLTAWCRCAGELHKPCRRSPDSPSSHPLSASSDGLFSRVDGSTSNSFLKVCPSIRAST